MSLTPKEVIAHGGNWLGIMRSFMQNEFMNGDRVEWGGNEMLQGGSFTPRQLEDLAARIAVAAIEQDRRQR